MRVLVLMLMVFFESSLVAQNQDSINIEKGYFASPVKHKIRLSGNFCELRNNHFHAGIDIKSLNKKIGDDILAVAEGYVSRVSVKMGGYGRTIYISHPCGLTSVYAHLHSFDKELEALIHRKQYEQKSFEIDCKLDSLTFPVTKGQVIAKLGNSGFSHGPHLHFEIRDSKTEIPLNPLDFDFPVEDNKPPVITGVKIQTLDIDGRPLSDNILSISESKDSTGKIIPASINGWRCGFLIKGYDSQNGSSNKNGFYSIEVFLDDLLIYKYRASHCSFEETVQMNGHIDYSARLNDQGFWHRCFVLPGNTLTLYDSLIDHGHLKLFEKKEQKVKIKVSDIHGNTSDYSTVIIRNSTDEKLEESKFTTLLKYKKANFFSVNGIRLFIPPDCLYYDVPFQYAKELADTNGFDLKLGYKGDAIKRPVRLEIDSILIPSQLQKDKLCLVFLDHFKETQISAGGKFDNNSFTCPISYFGNYRIMEDTISPIIETKNWKESWRKGENIQFKIKDNMVVFGGAKELEIEALLDGEWVLASYDLKRDLVAIKVDDHFNPGHYQLKVTAVDDRGNISTWDKQMTITP